MERDLSILIPARNEEFLTKTIEDILAHIEGNTEVIAVLDGWLPDSRIISPRVIYIHNETAQGQRKATNQAARVSKAKYVMKVDAHCSFDQGFDVKMMAAMQDNWTMIPVMRNLWAFDWVCKCGHSHYQDKGDDCPKCSQKMEKKILWIAKTNPQSTSYCFDMEPHFQYFNEYKRRPNVSGDITETMSIQGSCFMLTRDKYWELNISDETLGSWGSQGIEVACKTWLSGGRVVVNHKTWYAHMFRTKAGVFGFPYEQKGSQVDHAKKTVRELFFDNKWEGQIHPLSWLIEKFWPIPGWSEEMREKLKAWPLQKPKSAGILYYTDNQINEKIFKGCQNQLLKAAGDKKIVSVSLKPLSFGENISLPLERGYLTMFKQILTGLEALDTEVVFFCEHDVLYHPSHFLFCPPTSDKYYYNMNSWLYRVRDGFMVYYDHKSLSGLCADRQLLIKHYKERIRRVEAEGFSRKMGFEPGTHNRPERVDDVKAEGWRSDFPNIDLKHSSNLTEARFKKKLFRSQKSCENWQEAQGAVSGWDDINAIIS